MLLAGCTHTTSSADDSTTFSWDEDIIIVAHRGCWKTAPENSISAIRACLDKGVLAIELDVRRTKDGVLVLMHDTTVDRTTDGVGPVAALTLQEFKRLRLRNRDGRAATGMTAEHPPTLKQALIASQGRLLINIDAKEDVFGEAYALAEELGLQNRVLFKKETPFTRAEFAALNLPEAAVFMNKITQANGPLIELASRHSWTEPVALEIKVEDADYLTAYLREFGAQPTRLWVNTMPNHPEKNIGHSDDRAVADPEAHWGRLIELGFTMIQTDEPEALKDYLETRE